MNILNFTMNMMNYMSVGALMFGMAVPVLAAAAEETLSKEERTRNVIVQRMVEAGMIPERRAKAILELEVIVRGTNVDAYLLPPPGATGDELAFYIAPDLMKRVEFQLSKKNNKPTPHEIAAAYVLNVASAVIAADRYVYEKESGKQLPEDVTAAIDYSMLMSISNLMLGKNDTLQTFMPEQQEYHKTLIASIESGLAGEYVTYVPEKGIYIPKYEGASFVADTPADVELPELLQRMEQANSPKDQLKVLRLLNKEMPDTRTLAMTVQESPAPLPFDDLSADKAAETSNWLSGGKVVIAPSPQSVKLYNEVYYPCYQKFFRKCAKEEVVFQMELPVCFDADGSAYVDLLNGLNSTYSSITSKHGVKFGVVLLKTPSNFNAGTLKKGDVFKAEVSMYAVADNYAGAFETTSRSFGGSKSKMLQPVFFNLLSEKGERIRSAYIGAELCGAYNCGGGAMPVGNCMMGIDLGKYRCYLNKCLSFAPMPLSENAEPESFRTEFSLTENCYKDRLTEMIEKLESAGVLSAQHAAGMREVRVGMKKSDYSESIFSMPYVNDNEAIKVEIVENAWEKLYSKAKYAAKQSEQDPVEAADEAMLKSLAAIISAMDLQMFLKDCGEFFAVRGALKTIYENAMYVSYINTEKGTSVKIEDTLTDFEKIYYEENVPEVYLEYDRSKRVYIPIYSEE